MEQSPLEEYYNIMNGWFTSIVKPEVTRKKKRRKHKHKKDRKEPYGFYDRQKDIKHDSR